MAFAQTVGILAGRLPTAPRFLLRVFGGVVTAPVSTMLASLLPGCAAERVLTIGQLLALEFSFRWSTGFIGPFPALLPPPHACARPA